MINRAKQFCKDHKEEIVAISAGAAVGFTLAVIKVVIIDGRKVTSITIQTKEPAPEDMIVYVGYKNGMCRSFTHPNSK